MKTLLLSFVCGLALQAASIPAQDSRNTHLPDGNRHFTMPQFATQAEWQARAAYLKKQILSSAGLLPLPLKMPLHPEVFGKLEREGYSVEKVLLETYPGFYLGGNLYRPLGKKGPFPGVVSPHGHWDYGRLENTAVVSIPGRCINLAKQGFVVFTYDMVGYNDTTQIPHGDKGPRMDGPREDLWSINTMGLQLWNSIRAVDFLEHLPDVDATKISITGASGGGTQAFLLTAVDDRIKNSAPVNMISFIHQGAGCQEAANLRVDAMNVLFGAMMAPRPLLMVSASGDWTRNTPLEEFPAIQGIYRLFGAAANVLQVQVDSPHNYNKTSREAVYAFLNERVLGGSGPVKEQAFHAEPLQDLLVLQGRNAPANSLTMTEYVEHRVSDAKDEVARMQPRDAESLQSARAAFEERLRFSTLASLPSAEDVIADGAGNGADYLVLGRATKGDRIPALWREPSNTATNAIPTLLVDGEGTAGALRTSPRLIAKILQTGAPVLSIDAFQTGTAKAARDTTAPGFTVFNRTADANRVQDILTAIAYLRQRSNSQDINVIGTGDAGVWVLFAAALAGPGVNIAADLNRFKADSDTDYLTKFFIPGLRRAGDFRAAATLATRGKLLLHNADSTFPADWVRASAVNGTRHAQVQSKQASELQLIAWIKQ